MFEELM